MPLYIIIVLHLSPHVTTFSLWSLYIHDASASQRSFPPSWLLVKGPCSTSKLRLSCLLYRLLKGLHSFFKTTETQSLFLWEQRTERLLVSFAESCSTTVLILNSWFISAVVLNDWSLSSHWKVTHTLRTKTSHYPPPLHSQGDVCFHDFILL